MAKINTQSVIFQELKCYYIITKNVKIDELHTLSNISSLICFQTIYF